MSGPREDLSVDHAFSAEEIARLVASLGADGTLCPLVVKGTSMSPTLREGRDTVYLRSVGPDDELRRVCTQIRRLGTDDGNVLLFNIHVSTDSTSPAMVFPMPDELARANPYARLLAECSSIMPEAFDEAVRDFKGAGAVPPFYGMGYNTSIIELLSIINIGSRSITNIE